MKKIGFLSFGHWANHPSYKVRSASDALLQSIDLAVAAEKIGVDGAYFRVHHFAAQLASPFPLLAAIGAKKELAKDEAIQEADTLLLTIPNTLGVEYNVHVLSSILKFVAPELGWR
jgi:hypothetical protein